MKKIVTTKIVESENILKRLICYNENERFDINQLLNKIKIKD